MKKKVLVIITAFLFASCATTVKTNIVNKNYPKLADKTSIIVLEKRDVLPANSELIGDLKIGDSGFTTNCGYNKVLDDAKEASKNAGANILQILEVKEPSAFGSSCYRIKAKIYRNVDTEALAAINQKLELKNKSRLPADSDYALIHFYRPRSAMGALLGYKIKNNKDSIIGRLRNGEKFVFKTKNFDAQIFYGALETTEEVNLIVEKGKEYFVRCSVTMGVMVGRPEINIIENNIGIKEFEMME